MRVMLNEAAQASDFRLYIKDKLQGAKVPKLQIRGSNVLVAAYIAPEKTSGGIIRPGSNVQQDVWQGKIGLILKMGKSAFKYDGPYESLDEPYEIGDYVMYHASDARDLTWRGVACKLIDSSLIRMQVDEPLDFY